MRLGADTAVPAGATVAPYAVASICNIGAATRSAQPPAAAGSAVSAPIPPFPPAPPLPPMLLPAFATLALPPAPPSPDPAVRPNLRPVLRAIRGAHGDHLSGQGPITREAADLMLGGGIRRFGPIFAQYYGQSEAPMVITYLAKGRSREKRAVGMAARRGRRKRRQRCGGGLGGGSFRPPRPERGAGGNGAWLSAWRRGGGGGKGGNGAAAGLAAVHSGLPGLNVVQLDAEFACARTLLLENTSKNRLRSAKATSHGAPMTGA